MPEASGVGTLQTGHWIVLCGCAPTLFALKRYHYMYNVGEPVVL
jgi:hypothetical protein